VFVGYQEGTKGYRLWEIQSGGVKILISRDVIFNETIFSYKSQDIEETNILKNPDYYVVLGGPQVEVEQPARNNNLLVAPAVLEPDQGGVPLPMSNENHTSYHDDDQEE